MLRRATRPEGGAFRGFLQALEHQPADALAGFLRRAAGDAEPLFGIERGVGVAEPETTLRDLADPAPLAGHDAEDVADQVLRRRVARVADRARILVFDPVPP